LTIYDVNCIWQWTCKSPYMFTHIAR